MTSSWYFLGQNIVVSLIVLILSLLNYPPFPSREVWLILSNDIDTSFVGIQLIACDTETCDHPQLLQQFGQCETQNCMPLTPETSYETFSCSDNICYFVRPDNVISNYTKLLISIPNQTLESQIISGYSRYEVWQVTLEQNKLVIQDDPTYEPMGTPRLFRLFPDAVKFTLAVELAISLLYFQFWLKLSLVQLLRLLLIIALTHLITLPAVWFFFPTLGYFMSGASRIEGGIALSYTLVMFAFLLLASNIPLKFQLISVIGLTLMAFPICSFTVFITTFNNQDFYMTGLSKSSILLASELFAVVVEATLLTVLSRDVISKQQAIILCFITNTASAILGALLLW